MPSIYSSNYPAVTLLLRRNGKGLMALFSGKVGGSGYHITEYLSIPLHHITTGAVITPLDIPRRLRASYLANYIFALYIRRFFLLLFGLRFFDLRISGVLPEFNSI